MRLVRDRAGHGRREAVAGLRSACWAVALAVLLGAAGPAAAAMVEQPVRAVSAGSELDPGATLATPAPVSEAERAAAIAEPAIVVVDVWWQGYVRDRLTGALVDDKPVSASTRCTGAGVGGEGYLVTTGRCVDQSSVAAAAFQQLVDRRVADGSIRPNAAAQLLSELLTSAVIGSDPADQSQPEPIITVRRAVTHDEPMPATVVSVVEPPDGDAALLKIARNEQPILPLAESVSVGDDVVTLECPTAGGGGGVVTPAPTGGTDDQDPVDPRWSAGTVTATEPRVLVTPTVPGEPAALPAGVVLTHDAALVGLVDLSTPEQDILVDAAVIRELLERAEVDTELGAVDRDFRAGLDAYYEGQYTESIERFDAVLAIIPSHVQAHTYRDEAQVLRAEQGGGPAPADDWTDRARRWIYGRSGSLVGIGVLAAILVFLIHRRRPHPDAPPPGPKAAAGTVPVEPAGADVVDPSTTPTADDSR